MSVSTAGDQGNGGSGSASISADGRFVAFTSGASNLVAGDTNGLQDVFVRDRGTAKVDPTPLPPPADFDGNGTTDRSIYRGNGGWWVQA